MQNGMNVADVPAATMPAARNASRMIAKSIAGKMMRTILVTGAAGFIGFHLSRRLLAERNEIVGLDNLNPYYDVTLKQSRLKILEEQKNFRFVRADLADRKAMEALFGENRFEIVVNLAAQAGVRYSLENPQAYVENNLVGFMNILEGCRHHGVNHLVFASSSSVYGANTRMPFSVHDNVDHPLSLYAATKKANELMAHAYASPLQAPLHGTSLLHRLRTLGKAGHGPVPLHPGDPGGPADRRLQRRADEAGLHLHRRHRRGARSRPGADPCAESGLAGRRTRPLLQFRPVPSLQHREQPSRRADGIH